MGIDQILQAIALGTIQGLTEFIPVSSSAHLTITPMLFNWEQMGTTFILFAHLGTLIALIAYFWKDLWGYLFALIKFVQNRKGLDKKSRQDIKVVGLVALAAIPAALIGLLLEGVISDFYDNPQNEDTVILSVLLGMSALGVLFLLNDKFFTGKKVDMTKLTPLKALFIGFSQALAFIRGISRSGVTLMSGQLMGMSRVSAAQFSFLISIPILVGTSILGVLDIPNITSDELILALIGMVSAASSGYLAIRFMLNYLKRNGLAVFGWYRIAFAIFVAIILFY